MLRLLADENFNNAIVRGVFRALPSLDFPTVQQVGLSGMKDPDLLAWAFDDERILVTHDVQSMRTHVAARLAQGLSIAGVIAVPRRLPIGRAIYELRLCIQYSDPEEWKDQMSRLPL